MAKGNVKNSATPASTAIMIGLSVVAHDGKERDEL
jgi:hypothetical protein